MATGQYEHSEAFASLKRLQETLSTNLVSAHYLQALDKMLHNGIAPVVRNTGCFEGFLTGLIGWQEANRKRKVSFLDRNEFIQIAIAWLLIPTREGKAQQVVRLKLDRAANFEFLESFLESTQDYVLACSGLLNRNGQLLPYEHQRAYIAHVEKAFGSSGNLLPHIHEARYWLEFAVKFKTTILEKYVRLVLKTAQSDYQHYFKCAVNLDDLVQSYLLAAQRAIDKCDANQGVLTPYVQLWLKTAKAQKVAERKNDSNTYSIDDSSPGVEAPSEAMEASECIEHNELVEHVRCIARLIDPEGYGRAYLGILESADYLEALDN